MNEMQRIKGQGGKGGTCPEMSKVLCRRAKKKDLRNRGKFRLLCLAQTYRIDAVYSIVKITSLSFSPKPFTCAD